MKPLTTNDIKLLNNPYWFDETEEGEAKALAWSEQEWITMFELKQYFINLILNPPKQIPKKDYDYWKDSVTLILLSLFPNTTARDMDKLSLDNKERESFSSRKQKYYKIKRR